MSLPPRKNRFHPFPLHHRHFGWLQTRGGGFKSIRDFLVSSPQVEPKKVSILRSLYITRFPPIPDNVGGMEHGIEPAGVRAYLDGNPAPPPRGDPPFSHAPLQGHPSHC